MTITELSKTTLTKAYIEHDQQISKSGHKIATWVYATAPLAAAYFGDIKWTIAVGLAVVILHIVTIDARLYGMHLRLNLITQMIFSQIPGDHDERGC